MNIIVLDTETTGLDKPFCYDISWMVIDTDTKKLIDFSANVVEQIWHNLPLFESAYYKEKRQKYVAMMRKHDATMDKWGYIMRKLKDDIKKYDVVGIYAYNSDFDDKVIAYNCDWFKCNNPIENIPVYDIWGYASEYITCSKDYKEFCEEHQRFTDTGNYKGSAEVVFQYLENNPEFIEEHMGLFDSEIEKDILFECIRRGASWNTDYKAVKILNRIVKHPYTVKINGAVIHEGEYVKKYVRKDVYSFTEA